MEEIISLITKTYGIAGVIMLSPFMGLVVVWRHNVKLQKDKDDINKAHNEAMKLLREAITAVQEARVADAKSINDKILTFVAENAKVSSEISSALDQVRELLSEMLNRINTSTAK